MTQASIIYRACVPGSLADSLDREPVAVRTCARLRWRAHSDINPGSQQARNPASHQSAATTFLPVGIGRLAGRFERGGPCSGARRAAISQQGTRWICNLRGGLKALRSLSFRSRVKFCQEPGRVQSILFRPNYVNALSSLAAHVPEHAARSVGNVGKAVGESGNV